MHIVIHLTQFYDWAPVPRDVKIDPHEIGQLKPSAGGGFLMRVVRKMPTHLTVMLGEEQIAAKVIHEKCRPEGGRILSRKQAVAFYLAEHILPNEAERDWIDHIEIHDDAHEAHEFKKKLDEHVACGNIPATDVDAHVTAYHEKCDAKAMVDHLHSHFRVGKGKAN